MIFIDANIFLAYFNEDDVHHKKSMKIFEEIESEVYGSSFTSDYVFNEVVGVSTRKFGKAKALNLGNFIIKNIPIVNISNVMLFDSWKKFSSTNLTLNLVDCTNIIALSFVSSNLIATLDKEFEKVKEIEVVN